MRYGEICLSMVVGLGVLAGGCDKGKEASPEQTKDGRFEGSVYHNDYFGMTVAIPSDWTVQDLQTTRQMARTGERMIAGDNQNMQATLQAGEARTINLFNVFRHAPGSPVSYNPNIYAVAEDISQFPGIKSGSDYLFHARRLLEAGRMEFSFPREVYTEMLAGAEFHIMSVELDVPPTGKVMQEYFVTLRNRHVLVFILSFANHEERAELRSVLDTMKLAPQTD